ncbi:MAG: hypothetical protein Q8P26_00560 [Candidatus Levybacteria bacterium]|nr:hypothetical protein [Candidatus Levybacteria bacterium]
MNNPKTKNFNVISEDERTNFKATISRFPEEMKYADKLLYLYENLASHLSTYPRDLTPVLLMYWTCFRGFLISSQLMFQAHLPEAYAIISRSAEAVASARKMSINPEKVPEWIKAEKDTSQPFRRILGKLFPKEDKLLYPEIFNIYELMSECGRHPSFYSTIFFSNFEKMKTENKVEFIYCDIEDEANLKRSFNYQVYVYLKFLSVFKEIFKKHLAKDWIKEFDQFEDGYRTYRETLRGVFKSG